MATEDELPIKSPPRADSIAAVKVPTKSLSAAKTAFRNFSLSRFPDPSGAPATFVPPDQSVSSVQQRNHVNHLKSLDASGRMLRIALADDDLKKFFPSFDGKSVVLDDLMTLIQTSMRGTEYYTSGNPTLVRLAVQSKVSQIIQSIKNGQ